MVHSIDLLIDIHFLIILESFEIIISTMKAPCIVACGLLVIELKHMFSNHELMNVFGVIYPQY